ncbi:MULTISPECIES: IlvD/Edd family dehydratase [unclassified Variovorax]|uniref:IlvD/Edd family dehydratase n=1 Tax=unclassified Variovorax TaxID=663243 RepID=UPI00076CB372|nr:MULTISPECIES: IlvD/Edd family dehydratase [unclassified Variovorax]KWT75302.1 Xylonate dehydratase [Variovorax sp. WDL1]PNG51785.1 L-arabonate dehydratase [Variovorax sp. B2]PNG54132.1 L-arabonate dehydratase [Variovorax sp. B4]VTV11610.1 L-arabonate dehydratase [Variovorax sp. WDL1]
MNSQGANPQISPLRSRRWFNDSSDPGMTALYIERYMNYGITREELQSGKPIIGIAQTGSDLSPCNRHHIALASRVRDGIREAGGVPFEFPVHPIQETGKRPTAALDRNLAYLGLVEILRGYPIDAVVLTTGCDKTTPACLMAAATVNIPSIVLSGGPMLDGWHNGKLAGSGTVIWEARKLLAAGSIGYEGFIDMVSSAAPSAGHCNTMGTALSMNSLAEALGMSLPGCAAIPAPHRERGWMAYETGRRIVAMVAENLRPSDILTQAAFDNAVVAAAAIGASSNCPIHLVAIARHMGVDHSLADWQRLGPEIPLLLDCQPAGRYLGEAFHRAGGIPVVMKELADAGKLRLEARTLTGKTLGEDLAAAAQADGDVIRCYGAPLKPSAGYVTLSGNFFDNAVMKMSVIDEDFRRRFLSDANEPGVFEVKAVVFEGPEDYHDRIDDPSLGVDEKTILVMRNCGPIGYPGGAEVVNMQPPAALIRRGITELPTLGDGRQSGTSASPSILNVSPEAAVGGGVALLRSGDVIRIDLNKGKVDVCLSEHELSARRAAWKPPELLNRSPWEEIYRNSVGQQGDGACLEFATKYIRILETRGEARHNH